MIELLDAKKFAVDNDGADAVEIASDYNGAAVYKLVPFEGYQGMKLGTPILFSRRNDEFVFLSIDEVDDYMDWSVADVQYEDD